MAEPATASKAGSRLTTVIVIALLLGTAVGYVSHEYFPESSPGLAETLALLPTAFLRLVRMIIAPLVFSTLVVGIAKMGDIATVGRIGVKALGWFLFASLVSLTLGLVLVDLLQPGTAMHLPIPAGDAATGLKPGGLTLEDFISHTIPTSVLDAMARNEILQIVVFSVFFGVAMAGLGERTAVVLTALDGVSMIMLRVTGYVMLFAPLAVFGALASIVAKEGLGIIRVYGLFVGEFYLGIFLLWAVLTGLGSLFLGTRALDLVRRVREPVLLAFSTASSEAAYPKTLEELERFGV